jgi:hypothetical protein
MGSICAYAVGYGPHYALQAKMLRNSFKRFHPNIDVFVFDETDEQHCFGKIDDELYIGVRRLKFGSLLFEQYDSVILFGTDVVICDRLDHIVDSYDSYDVVATLDIKRPSPLAVDGSRYANADVICINEPMFMHRWHAMSDRLCREFRLPPHGVNDWEQGVLNYQMLPDPNYLVWFPEHDHPVYYNHRSRWFWKGAYVKCGKLYAANGRLIKAIHWNGSAGTPPNRKIVYQYWSTEVIDFLSETTGVDLAHHPAGDVSCNAENAFHDLGGGY